MVDIREEGLRGDTAATMVAHNELQHYKRHYCTALLTGVFGCRWHRYKQSKANSGKCNVAWFLFLILVVVLALFWFYFWLMADNSFDLINWFAFRKLGVWYNWYSVLFILSCTTLAYAFVLLVLALCHLCLGYQLFMHYVHRVILFIILLFCIAFIPLMVEFWREGYKLVIVSFMITSPFLHFCAVCIMTMLTWIIAGQWVRLYSVRMKIICLLVYAVMMVALYLSPLFIQSPCIISFDELPAKPRMLAHKGLSELVPENTMMAFEGATKYDLVIGLESDISISYDGVPFVMHDSDLKRTTNVKEVFPQRADDDAFMFNMSELRSLDAGSWFLKLDPFGRASRLTDLERVRVCDLQIPTLSEYAELVFRKGLFLMFDIKVKMGADVVHPFKENYTDVIIDTLLQSSLPQHRIWWLYADRFNRTENFTKVGSLDSFLETQRLLAANVSQVNVNFNRLSWAEIKNHQQLGIKTNIYVINSDWLYSVYWCMGVESVTTDVCDEFSKLDKPVWHMTRLFFRVMWITVDVLSFVIVIILFVVQRMRKSWHCFRPDGGGRMTMKVVPRGQKMKEKLLEPRSAADSLNDAVPPSEPAPATPSATPAAPPSQGGGDTGVV